jgi:hypothetical protein
MRIGPGEAAEISTPPDPNARNEEGHRLRGLRATAGTLSLRRGGLLPGQRRRTENRDEDRTHDHRRVCHRFLFKPVKRHVHPDRPSYGCGDGADNNPCRISPGRRARELDRAAHRSHMPNTLALRALPAGRHAPEFRHRTSVPGH